MNLKILSYLKKKGKGGASFDDLVSHFSLKRKQLDIMLRKLEGEEKLVCVNNKYFLFEFFEFKECTVTRTNATFAFASTEEGEEFFIPGAYLLGAMEGDVVLIRPNDERPDDDSGKVFKIKTEKNGPFTGTVAKDDYGKFVTTGNGRGVSIKLDKRSVVVPKSGETVVFEISRRGRSHRDHRACVLQSYGVISNSKMSVRFMLDESGLRTKFPKKVAKEAELVSEKSISDKVAVRSDLRSEAVFTIDSASTKDIDDAISIKKLDDGYRLSVHIADVSHYVKFGSELDNEAIERGTSVYYGNKVIPMLPKQLSNGVCSLNEKVDRLALSCVMTFSRRGIMEDFVFKKSVIHSRVKGVYAEINEMLEGRSTPDLELKYREVSDSFEAMVELYELLKKRREDRGAVSIETSESYCIFDEEDRVIDIKRRERGLSEQIIEEFMLSANMAAAVFGKSRNLPFIYRVHESPDPERIENLKALLRAFNIEPTMLEGEIEPASLEAVLQETKPKRYGKAVNIAVLRSMAKAVYESKPKGHFGLAMDDYAHFTSPIRRYPDLYVHRAIKASLDGAKIKGNAETTAVKNSESEQRAVVFERNCDDVYRSEYIAPFVGEVFTGEVSSIAPHGIYVELPNTVEGLVRIKDDALREGGVLTKYYSFDLNRDIMIGDEVSIKVIAADVLSGKIDFEFVVE